MKKIGYFSHKSASGRFIIKIHNHAKPPRLGSKIFNSDGKAIGLLVDIIGPAENPYGVIKPLTLGVKLEPFDVMYIRGFI